jgi:putative DNA primase/helicase
VEDISARAAERNYQFDITSFENQVERGAAENRAGHGEDNAERDQAFIKQLAELSPLSYEQQRLNAAKVLNLRAPTLDKLVKDARTSQPEELLYPWWKVEPSAEPIDAERLLTRIVGRVRSHVVLSDHAAYVVALWTVMTWVHEGVAVHSPILLVTSPEPGSGKSTLLGVLSFLVRRSLSSVGITAAPMYRAIEKWQPTIMVDEADVAFVDNDDLRAVANSGWTRGQGVVRCDSETHEPHMFSTFCPKALGMKGRRLPDTTMSRAITIEMAPKKPSERAHDFQHVDDNGLAELRSEIARYAADNADLLRQAQPALPSGFENRRAANWKLLLAIADTAGDEWGRKARTAAVRIAGTPLIESVGTDLLADCRRVRDARPDTDCIPSKQLVEALTADPESRWCEWGRGRNPITQKQVAGLLRDFHIVSGTVHPIGQPDAKGYRWVDFEEVWGRYLPPETPAEAPIPPSETSKRPSADEMGTSRTFSSVRETSSGRIENGKLCPSHAGLDAWTDRKPESAPMRVSAPPTSPAGDTPAVGLCAQCHLDQGAPPTLHRGAGYPPEGVWLHSECVRFYLDLSVPAFLVRQ